MNNRIVIEIKDNKIVRQWNSINQAAKELYLTRQTIMNYCNNKTKKKQFNLMWKKDYILKGSDKE